MKNLTVSVPEDVYRRARVKAAERGTSVSALVAAYLRRLAEEEGEFERLAALEKQLRDQIEEFTATDRLDRDRIHDRAFR